MKVQNVAFLNSSKALNKANSNRNNNSTPAMRNSQAMADTVSFGVRVNELQPETRELFKEVKQLFNRQQYTFTHDGTLALDNLAEKFGLNMHNPIFSFGNSSLLGTNSTIEVLRKDPSFLYSGAKGRGPYSEASDKELILRVVTTPYSERTVVSFPGKKDKSIRVVEEEKRESAVGKFFDGFLWDSYPDWKKVNTIEKRTSSGVEGLNLQVREWLQSVVDNATSKMRDMTFDECGTSIAPRERTRGIGGTGSGSLITA